jgi:hypothetical protein
MNGLDRPSTLGIAYILSVTIIVPVLAVGILYETFLGHRHDYTGHFAAGYGGTLGAMMVMFRVQSDEQFTRSAQWSVVLMCVACILLGTFAEATAFRLAKFDEIDFCNQSIGAVLASMATLAFVGQAKPPDKVLDTGLISGIAILGVGGCFAFA